MHLCCNLRVEHAANIVTLLLDKGCPLNFFNDKRKTALIIASETLSNASIPQRTTVIETLLERGAQVNAKDSEGKTAVIYELEKCFQDTTSTDVIRALVCAGAHFCSLERVHINLHHGYELLYPLIHMFRNVSQVLSQRQIRSLQTLVRRMSRLCRLTSRRQMLDALDKVVDINLHVVPTLTQLCRITVRDCLVGDGSERGERENRAESGCTLSDQGKAVPPQEAACGRGPSDRTIGVEADKTCPDSPEPGKENLSPGVEASEGCASLLTEGFVKERLEGENNLGECAARGQDKARKRRSRRNKGLYEGISVLPLPEKVKTFLMFRSCLQDRRRLVAVVTL
ncbi:fibronectin type 3 and ankyrin repeat domains [Plakobranchus ocellatus]|uniref:Fibronectin type 3 and ankyrin repeat domains n=1 Tax=Plakobranchus ocellatus TaxID=259542 RepID=A0AAV4BM99_9GAST|nr:fibronectin type 3 and ankyrin repeat domains [Plakobranchus ocellatus]